MEIHPMPAFVHQRDPCGLKIRADYFHRWNPFGKHQSIRRQFSGGFHRLQFIHQFEMQRARLFLAALALCHWNGIKRIGHVQMQITPAQRIDFTTAQSGVQREQIQRSARASQQLPRFVVIQCPAVETFLAARIHFGDEFKRIGCDAVLFAEPGEQRRQRRLIFVDGFGGLLLSDTPTQE
jgi:hypothetical protein